jgi:uncharacterized protein YecE (DUF72 family)
MEEAAHVKTELRLGTAGWNVPRVCKERVGGVGSQLERYARVLNATEINSSFHKPHRRSTYEKWANATPDDFRFSVKVPKSVTHSSQLAQGELDRFIEESAGLGAKLGVLLVQFAPRKMFVESDAEFLFRSLQERTSAALACEPRHVSWFTPEVSAWAEGTSDWPRRRGSGASARCRPAGRVAGPALFSTAWSAAHLLLRVRRGVPAIAEAAARCCVVI